MGFGFNLLMVFIIFPTSVVMFIIWLIWRPKMLLKTLGIIWGSIFSLVLLVIVIHFFTDKKDLEKSDIYGEYIIDRTKFPGKQSDWQYEHYSFEVTPQNKFLFHIRQNDKIIHTDSGSIKFLEGYNRPRLAIAVDSPRNHIINDQPTLYRAPFSFYYVFHSPKFGNVFFTRGKWKPLDK